MLLVKVQNLEVNDTDMHWHRFHTEDEQRTKSRRHKKHDFYISFIAGIKIAAKKFKN